VGWGRPTIRRGTLLAVRAAIQQNFKGQYEASPALKAIEAMQPILGGRERWGTGAISETNRTLTM